MVFVCRMTAVVRLTSLLVVLVALVGTSGAQSPTTDKNQKAGNSTTAAAPATQDAPSTSAGQRVFIDPVTKQPKEPTPEEVQALEAAGKTRTMLRPGAAAVQKGPVPIVGTGGAVGLMLDEDSMVYAVATKDTKGKVAMGCVEGKSKAESVVHAPPSQAPAKKEVADER